MADEKDPLTLQLKNVRLSFAQALYTAKRVGNDPNSQPGYSCSFLMDPKTPHGKKNIAMIEKAIAYAKSQKWKDKIPKIPAAKVCLRDGNEQDWDGYEGMMYLSASNKKRPVVLDRMREPVREGDDEAPYSGCRVDAIVRIWIQDNDYGKRVNCSLEGVRFRGDGEAFGAKSINPNDFDELDEDEDDEEVRKPAGKRSRDEDEDDDEPAPRKRRPARDEDEDDEPPPRKKRPARDEDEDDEPPPRKKRPAPQEDDDDEPPRKPKRRPAEDDDEDERPARKPSRRPADDDDDEDRPARNSRSRRRPAEDEDDDGI